MALAFTAGTPAVSTGSVTTINVPLVSGTTTDDYTIIAVASNSSSGGVTTPAGWTNILANTNTVTGSTSGHFAIFYRKWQSGDADPVTVTITSGRVAACAIRVRGADLTTFVDTAASVTQDPDNGTTHDAPAITTTASPVLCYAGMMRHATAGTTFTWTGPGGDTELVDCVSTDAAATNAGFAFYTSAVTAGTSTGTRTMTSSQTSTGAMGVSFALAEAAAAGNVTVTPSAVAAIGALPAPAELATAVIVPSTLVATAAAPALTFRSDQTVPFLAPPVNVQAVQISSSQIDVSWDAVGGASGYLVERDGVVVATNPDTTYSDTGLTPATTYVYRVKAVA